MRIVMISALMLGLPAAALAQGNPIASLDSGLEQAGLSLPMQIALAMTALTLLPAAIMSVTPFLRTITVLHFLRQALGTQSAPSNQILVGLALFLSLLVMKPVANDIYTQAWEPMTKGDISLEQALRVGAQPLRDFLLRFVKEPDIRLFVEMSGAPAPPTPQELDLSIIIPSYILSELKVGFQIGAVLFLPFLIIDLVVASVTLSIGMIQLPPVMLSAPFKILLFVLVDGWTLVIGSLMRSFYP